MRFQYGVPSRRWSRSSATCVSSRGLTKDPSPEGTAKSLTDYIFRFSVAILNPEARRRIASSSETNLSAGRNRSRPHEPRRPVRTKKPAPAIPPTLGVTRRPTPDVPRWWIDHDPQRRLLQMLECRRDERLS